MKIENYKKKIDKMINEASNIFIMGHRYLDLDALGSSIGMYQILKKRRNPQVDSRLPGSFSMCVAYVLNATFSLSSASTRILRGQARLSRWNPSPLFPKKIPLPSQTLSNVSPAIHYS